MGLLYSKETYLIRGACFKVWKEFGGAFKEKIIENALAIELEKQGQNLKDSLESKSSTSKSLLATIFLI